MRGQLRQPFLAANAIRTDNGQPYFSEYAIIRRHGLKIAVIGFTNPGIPGWLSPELWSGMEYRELVPYAQEVVDKVRSKEKPDIVAVAVHGGIGDKEYKVIESPGMALFNTLKGVDLLFCAHDHRPVVHDADSIALVNSGSHCKYLGQGIVNVTVKDGKVKSKSSDASLIEMNAGNADIKMRTFFQNDYNKVKEFTLREVGELSMPLRTVDAYAGMSDYMNLLHTLSLSVSGADVSFAAPLTYDGIVPAGTVLYNDLFKIYPYENQLYVVKMTGKEIKDCLEYSYDNWIFTYDSEKPHLLKIRKASDPRTGQKGYSFISRFYNFDSAGGIVYNVDVTQSYGRRVVIKSFADGALFDEAATYNVAMTSYRANGGGGLLGKGAGIDTSDMTDRIVARYPEIRELLYRYIKESKTIDRGLIADDAVIGSWEFVPSSIADKAIASDLKLMFGDR